MLTLLSSKPYILLFTLNTLMNLEKFNLEVYENFGSTAKVFLIGFSHREKMDNEENISQYLKETLVPSDTLLLEGNDPIELDTSRNDRSGIVGRLSPFLHTQGIRALCNDNFRLGLDYQLQCLGEKQALVDGDSILYSRYNHFKQQLFNLRDENFCLNPDTGLVALAQKGKTQSGKLVQLVGIGHIYAGNIARLLKENYIPYTTIVDKKIFLD